MGLRVQTDGGALNNRPVAVGKLAKHATTRMRLQLTPMQEGGRPIFDNHEVDIARQVTIAFFRSEGNEEEARKFEDARGHPNPVRLFAILFLNAESRYGRIPLIPDSVREWAERVTNEEEDVGTIAGGLIQIRVPAMWLADP